RRFHGRPQLLTTNPFRMQIPRVRGLRLSLGYIAAVIFVSSRCLLAGNEELPTSGPYALQLMEDAVRARDFVRLEWVMGHGNMNMLEGCARGMAEQRYTPREQAKVWEACLQNEEFWEKPDGWGTLSDVRRDMM